MTEWKCPKITIADVPIPAQAFVWGLTSGVSPFMTNITVPLDFHAILESKRNPVEIVMELSGGTDGKPTVHRYKFSNVWLLNGKKISPFLASWDIADARWPWRGKKLFFSYNKTRVKNQKGQAINSTDLTPASLRKPYDTYSVGRYIPWSVKGNGRPWTIKEILFLELEKLGVSVDRRGEDTSYILENVEMNGEDIYSGFEYLLRLSRLGMGITPAGKTYIYSLDFYDDKVSSLEKILSRLVGVRPGVIAVQKKKNLRPRRVSVRFEKKCETRIVASTSISAETPARAKLFRFPISPRGGVWTQQDIDNQLVIGCENVIQIPVEMTLGGSLSGETYHPGEWVPMWFFLQGVGLTDSQVRQSYFNGFLEYQTAVALASADGADISAYYVRRAHHIIGAIKSHYRQTYMIEPYMMDRIASWETRRAAVINNYDRYSQVSPLFADYCIISYLRDPNLVNKTKTWNQSTYNWIVNDEDPSREQPTPGTVSVVSQPLGIFRVSYPTPMDQVTFRMTPFSLDDPPFPALSSGNPYMKNSKIAENHTLETILSVIWNVDKSGVFDSDKKYFQIDIDYSGKGGVGPDISWLSRAEYARLPACSATSDTTKPINEGMIQALAQSEAGRIVNQFRDRYVGLISAAGYVDTLLNGNLRQIMYEFNEQDGFLTTLDMRDIPPPPTLEQQLPQGAIDFLHRHVNNVDSAAEAKT